MKISNKEISSTQAIYAVEASSDELLSYKLKTLNANRTNVKVPGFRPGKAPVDMIEKHLDPAKLQNDFLNQIINDLYLRSIDELVLRVVNEPKIDIIKFVPYSSLEFKVEVEVITKIKLPDYKSFNIKQIKLPVTKEQLDNTLQELKLRGAKYTPVDRAAKLGDQVEMDFEGSDAKTKEILAQASGMDYRLILGSKNFIPGFEEQLVGVKVGATKSFDITFPKDYQDQSFKSRKVTFNVTIKEVSEVEQPKLDDKFAASLGPFKTFKEFESELKRQIEVENNTESLKRYEEDILNKLAESTVVDIPKGLLESEIIKLESDAKQSALYRGQSWSEFLSSIGKDEADYHKDLEKLATIRIQGGLAIGEIAKEENIVVTQIELDEKLAQLKQQYTDPQMLEELDNPNNKREIMMRLLSEKVLDRIKNSMIMK
jgi:trigger factor